MERVSSNQTLFLKFFMPVFWIVFFGAFTLASLSFKFSYVGNIPALYFRIFVVFFYISGLAMFAFTLMRLVRVEMGPESIYITNYFKHVQYPFASVASVEVSGFAFLKIGVIRLHEKGVLGKRLNFIAHTSRLEDYWVAFPDVKAQLLKED